MNNTRESEQPAYTVSLPVFAGPLDLLLRLIERAELDITAISLAHVADQFLIHVRQMDAPDPRELAEFVSMAARLLLIKSRALLPRPPANAPEPSEIDDAEALARQLREYQRYKQAAQVLRTWHEEGRRTFLRQAPAPIIAPLPSPLDHSLADLLAAVQRRIQLQLPLEVASETVTLVPRLTVQQVASHIRQRLERQQWFDFEDLLGFAITRQELIVTFWAVLELIKRRAIVVEQTELFGAIGIGKGSDSGETLWDLAAEVVVQEED